MDHLSSFWILQVLSAFLMVFVCSHNILTRAQIADPPCSVRENGAIRLWKHGSTSRSFMSGTVQICFKRYWGNICDNPRFGFGFQEAHVVCHQLGYTGASKVVSNSQTHDLADARIAEVHCNKSSYLTLLQCSYKDINSGSDFILCTDQDDVSVSCYAERIWSNPFDGMIRLQDGDLVSEGRVEVFCNGQWGTVCDRLFNQTSADLVCKQLGYTEAVEYNHLTALSGMDSQSIWLDHLICSSNDRCLTSCQQCPTTATSICQHNEDATVACMFSQSSRPHLPAEVDTCKAFMPSNGYAVLVGSIVGGVAGMACVIFSLCTLCYVCTLCCSKPRTHLPSLKTPPSDEKKVVMCTSLPAEVIRSLDAPPPYTVTTPDKDAMFTASILH